MFMIRALLLLCMESAVVGDGFTGYDLSFPRCYQKIYLPNLL
jgi:hypothetical protein